MLKRNIHIVLCFVLGLLFIENNAIARVVTSNKDTSLQSSTLPSSFQSELDSLKESDRLDAWLDVWYVHLADNPTAHYKEFDIPLKTIWRKPRTSSEQVAWFYLLILVGYHELQQGNILQSTHVYEEAYQFVQSTNTIHNEEILEYLIKPLGNNYTRLGDYERALYIQKEGLKLAKTMDDPMQEASLLANMSTTARWNDHLQEALLYTKQALQKVNAGTALQGLIFSTQADILQDDGQVKEAEATIQKAIHLFSKMSFKTDHNDAYWFAGALVTAGDIAQKKRHDNEAGKYYLRALHVFRQYFPQSKYREKMKVQIALGQVSLAQKDYRNGLQHFNHALNGILPKFNKKNIWPEDSILYPENTLLDGLTGKAKLLHLMGKDSLALIGYQKAAIVLQQLRRTIFSREAKRLLQQQSLQTTEEAISVSFDLFSRTTNTYYAQIALELAEQHKARLLLNNLQENISYTEANQTDSLFIKQKRLNQAIAFYTHSYIDAILSKSIPDSLLWKLKIDQAQYKLSLLSRQVKEKYPAMAFDSPIQIKKFYTTLPKGIIVWEYFVGLNNWYGFAINNKGVIQFSDLGKAGYLKEPITLFINHWFSNGPQRMINQPKSYYEDAFSIYKKLQLKLPTGDEKLIIIPDGVLGKLPFEALLTDSLYHANPGHWPYLLRKAVTSQCYSLSVWYQLQKEFSKSNHLGGFSGFFIDPEKGSNLATLAGVEKEESGIHNIVQGNFYKNRNATAEKFLQAVQKSEVIHVSTHAFLMADQQIPALQMADKRIVLADLYSLQAHPALVVMSACQTADGILSPGEGIISLAREFTAIGTGGVVAALWSINDETAADQTTLFYKNLQQSSDKAGALYQAKKEWLQDDRRNTVLKLPYYWAGLVYYGNNQPLSQPLAAPFQFPFWGWKIIAGLLILILAWWKRKWIYKMIFSRKSK